MKVAHRRRQHHQIAGRKVIDENEFLHPRHGFDQ
jgi:hypothetical protein